MPPVLYMVFPSPPVRAVLLTASAIGLELEYREINLMNGEHLDPEFLKINPQHTIPTLDDDGFYLWDSHAIMTYLVSKYGEGSDLYPEDPAKRALVDQRLYFDTGTIFPLLTSVANPLKLKHSKIIPQDKIDSIHKAYEFLETFLEGQDWIAGDSTTLADLSLITTVSTLEFLVPIQKSKFPKVLSWIYRCQKLPYYSINQAGLDNFKVFFATFSN